MLYSYIKKGPPGRMGRTTALLRKIVWGRALAPVKSLTGATRLAPPTASVGGMHLQYKQEQSAAKTESETAKPKGERMKTTERVHKPKETTEL
jgi:hypothetical protein